MNNIEKKKINIIPDRSLMPKIGQAGYSISQAIAELVDNSIDAREEGKKLTVEINLPLNKDVVEVIDNGIGMDEKTAINSIKLAHSSKKGKLGEFGLGLKTACSCLGKSFQIKTSANGSPDEYIIDYDEDEWLKSGSWTEHEMKIKKNVDKNQSGTTIKISKIRFKSYPNLPGKIREDLSIRFAPYIENGEVEIRVNTKWCKSIPLDLKTEYCPPDGKEKFEILLKSGNKITGWRGLLKKGYSGNKGEYGFRVFRRGRLISQFAKIGFSPHPEARQIVGELHLDHVPVTHNKREFIEESPLYQEVIEENGIFWDFMRSLVKEARTSMRKTKIGQDVIDRMEEQKENIMKAIKRIPELKEYAFPDLREKIKGTKENNEGMAVLEIEKRDPREMVTIEEQPAKQNEKTRNGKKTHPRKTYSITINGKKFKLEHSFVDLKTEDVLKDKDVDKDSGIHVFTNISFPAFANTKDPIFYGVWHVAEAVAEVMVDENGSPATDVIKIRDLILKKSAEITQELDNIEKDRADAERLKKEYEEKMAKIKSIEKDMVA